MSRVNHAISALKEREFDKIGLDEVIYKRFIVAPSFQLYTEDAKYGLFDYGPLGCAIKTNLINVWRQHFVEHDNMLEVECSCLTPESVLKTSGHVKNFNDVKVKDLNTGTFYRADHLLISHMDQLLATKNLDTTLTTEYQQVRTRAGCMNQEELRDAFVRYNIKAPETGNDLEEPKLFNNMFSVQTGTSPLEIEYLRPETAQGMFVNFKNLLEYNDGKLPFAAAQVGSAFRNEISVRSGLMRVREFILAEIEHFVHPNNKSTPKFTQVAHLELNLLSADSQINGGEIVITTPLSEAVSQKIIAHETIAYIMGRVQQFLVLAGINPDMLRFRQHLPKEMAHYASDCWDAEVYLSCDKKWWECVGIADRGDFDLSQHSKATGINLHVCENGENITPHVIEPAFGIGRIFYCILEHSYHSDGRRTILSLPPIIAPIKVFVIPLIASNNQLVKITEQIVQQLKAEGLTSKVFSNNNMAIGSKYARADDMGIPYGITIDLATPEDNTVTLRDRDSARQVRILIPQVSSLVRKLCDNTVQWSCVLAEHDSQDK